MILPHSNTTSFSAEVHFKFSRQLNDFQFRFKSNCSTFQHEVRRLFSTCLFGSLLCQLVNEQHSVSREQSPTGSKSIEYFFFHIFSKYSHLKLKIINKILNYYCFPFLNQSQLNFTASEFEQLDGRNFTETFANGTNSNDQLNITVRTGNYSYAYPEEVSWRWLWSFISIKSINRFYLYWFSYFIEIQLNNSTGVRYSEQVNYTEASVNGIVFQRNFSQNSSSPYHSEFNNFTSALEQVSWSRFNLTTFSISLFKIEILMNFVYFFNRFVSFR